MSFAVAVKDAQGNRTEYDIKSFGDITIGDWKRITLPKLEALNDIDFIRAVEQTYEMLTRYTTIPREAIRLMPPKEVERLIEALETLIKDQAEARVAAEQEALVWDGSGPDFFTFKGVSYRVPKDLEKDTVWGQWVDLEKAMMGVEHEAEVYADICAALLIPQGQPDNSGFTQRLEAFDDLPVSLAIRIAAFFLDRSERLRNVASRCMSHLLTSKLRKLAPVLTSLQTGTTSGPPSLKLLD